MTKRIFIRILYVIASIGFFGLVFSGCFGERVPEGDKTEAGLRPAPGSLVSEAAFEARLLKRLPIADRSGSLLVVSRKNKDGSIERYHPYGGLAMPVLGYLDEYGRGLDGIEYAFDGALLSQASGLVTGNRQALGLAPLHLTIDRKIQARSEDNLRWQMRRLKAARGSQIIMDLSTGQVLSMSSFSAKDGKRWQAIPSDNFALEDGIDPWALVVNLAWLNRQQEILLARSRQEENAQDGTAKPETRPDYTSWHWLQLGEKGKLWTRVTADTLDQLSLDNRLLRQLITLGLGQPTGINLPGEKQGALPVSLSDNVTTMINSGMNASPLQLLCAFSAIIKGGIPVQPVIAEYKNGPEAQKQAGKEREALFDQEALEQFLSTIGDNHGPSIASVTRKTDDGGASHEIIGMGFWPAKSPKISYITVLEDAKIDASRRRGTLGRTALVAREAASLSRGNMLAQNGKKNPGQTGTKNQEAGHDSRPWIMPDLRGRSLRSALEAVDGLGLNLRIKGAGTVTSQHPRPGSKIKRGAQCLIVCKS